MFLSEKAKNIQFSPIRKLKPLADEAKSRGIRVYHLNIGQPDIATPKEIIDVYRNYNEKVLAYGPAQGLDLYRRNLLKYYARYDIRLNVNDITVTTAGSEAIIFALLSICNPGDEIIIPEPFYANYNSFAEIVGAKIIPLQTSIDNAYHLPNNEEITKLITNKTRAILICNPSNPTGVVYSKNELERLARIARDFNLYIISDEVYREFVYDQREYISFLNIDGINDYLIMVDSISKRYSACGARVGCLVSRNKEIMKAVLKFAQARLCPPTIDQLAANAAINISQEYFDTILKEYEERRDFVFKKLSNIEGVVCQKPAGAFYIMAKLPVDDAENFVKWLLTDFSLDNETLMLAPAKDFYASSNLGIDEVRIAYVLNKNDLAKSMKILKVALEKYVKHIK